MINVIMYSFDRACQLDLALRSIKDQFVEWDQQSWTIIIKASNPEYKKAYQRVRELHPDQVFKFVEETNFRTDTINAFNSNRPYTTWMMDDDAFIRSFSIEDHQFKRFASDPSITSLSCRLAPYMDKCYTQHNRPVKVPPIAPDFTWDWRKAHSNDLYHGYPSDWGYPMSIAGFQIFRTNQISHIINNASYRAPNSFENALVVHGAPGDKMLCYPEARNLNIPINKVQLECANTAGSNPELQQGALNASFLSGKRLSTNNVYGAVTPSPHYEINLELE